MAPTKQRSRRTGKSPTKPRVTRRPNIGPGDRKLLEVIEWTEFDDDDNPVDGRTTADVIIDAVRRNHTIPEACAAAGVDPWSFKEWRRQGREVAADVAAMQAGTMSRRQLKRHEQAVLWFVQALEQAEAIAEQRLVHALDARATGEGLTQAVVTRELEPDPSGRLDAEGRPVMKVVKQTEKRNRVLPDTAAVTWLLSHRHRERWANTDTLEVVTSGGATVEHHHTHSVPVLEDMLARVAAKIEGNVIDVKAAEADMAIPPLGEGSEASDDAGATGG